MTKYLLNFGHQLIAEVLGQLQPIIYIKIPFHLDLDGKRHRPVAQQVVELVDAGQKLLEAQGGKLDGSVPILVSLPGITEGAALLLADLYGRLGRFPQVLSFRKDKATSLYQLNPHGDAIIDLDAICRQVVSRR